MTRREKYLEQIYSIFCTENIDGLTMVDIAERINVTKMTLYNNFKDKSEIIEAIINYRSLKYIDYFDKANCESKNAIEVLMTVLEFQRKHPLMMVPYLYHTLSKNYPEQFNSHEIRFRNSLKNFIKANIIQGQEEDIFRQDVDAEEISMHIIMSMENMLSSALKNGVEVDLNQVHNNIIKYHIRGIANEKGLELFKSLTN